MEIQELAQQLEVGDDLIRGYLAALAIDAYDGFTQSGNRERLDDAIKLARGSIGAKDSGFRPSVSRLNNLGVLLETRYERMGEIDDLEEAITVARQAVDSTPADHPDLAACLNNLGSKLQRRYERTGEAGNLEEAIAVTRQAVELTPADHPDRAGWLNNLGNTLQRRYERMGEMVDLEKAITVARQAVDWTPADHPDRAGKLSNLGIKLQRRYERTGEIGNLKEAIAVTRQAVELTPVDHPDRAGRLSNLGNKLQSRYERTGEAGNLEEAIAVTRQAVELTPADHPHRAGMLDDLGNTLQKRYERIGEMADLEEAITVTRQAVDSTPVDHPERAGRLNNLGNKLQRQYERMGEMVDLEKAITVARQAVELTPADHPDRAGRLNNLGSKLQSRHERTGEMGNLEEAIAVARQAVDSTPADHPDLAACLNNLGSKLQSRHERTGEMGNLEEAIAVTRQAVELTPVDHPDRAGWLNDLGNTLQKRYERIGEMADLEEAITVARQAVDSTPVDHPERAGRLNNLGIKLQRRYERMGEMVDLEKAITVARQAVELTPVDHPDRAGRLSNLGNKLQSRYERMGEMVDLEKAITVARQAVELTPADHPDRAGRLNNLGNKLQSRYERTGETSDLEEASSCLHAAWSCQNAIPFHRVIAAARGIELLTAQLKIDTAIELGEAVLNLVPVVNTRLLDRSDQQFVMSLFAGVATNVCACLLASGQPASALESLEKGRAVIISQLVDGKDDLASLRTDYYQISCRYERLRNEINATTGGREHRLETATRRREALAELDECISNIRGCPGHERFLLGQTVAEMQDCAQDGTIVVVNITDFRSDAILVSKSAICALNLPRLLAADATVWLSKRWTGREGRKKDRGQKNKEYIKYLFWLWDVCVKPVLDALDISSSTGALPRIWWIGTGLGSSMPFHAAGVHSPDSTENALSKVVSSYTPSIKTLGFAQRQAHITEGTQASFLLATMPTTPADPLHPDTGKLCDLPGVVIEEQRVRELLAGHIPMQSLRSPSVAHVIEEMRHCSIAHFACHGLTDHRDLFNSGLILRKHHGQDVRPDRLTVRQVSELSLSDARIAYLSACSTAENKAARLADEVIHVVSGFQVAGFPHVVGCLWPSIDRVCVEVAGEFYKSLLRRRSWDRQAVASAVRAAVMAVRDEDMRAPLVWAQFVHFGA